MKKSVCRQGLATEPAQNNLEMHTQTAGLRSQNWPSHVEHGHIKYIYIHILHLYAITHRFSSLSHESVYARLKECSRDREFSFMTLTAQNIDITVCSDMNFSDTVIPRYGMWL